MFITMNNCCPNLYLLSTIACKLSDCLYDDELAELSADLVVLSVMLANILAHKATAENRECLENGEHLSDS